MPGPESRLVGRIVKAVRKHYPGAWVFKVHGNPYQPTGIPDLLICIQGILIGAEVKCLGPGESRAAARNRVSPQQRQHLRLINEAGGMAGVVMSIDDTLELIERALAHRGPGNTKEKET